MRTISMLIPTLLLLSISHAAEVETVSSSGCGQTKPRFCVNESVIVKYRDAYGYFHGKKAIIAGYNSNGTYSTKSDSGTVESNWSVDKLFKTKACGNVHKETNIKFCAGEKVIYVYKNVYGYNQTTMAEVAGVSSDGESYVTLYGDTYAPDIKEVALFKTRSRECSKTEPRFCIDEPAIRTYKDVYGYPHSENVTIAGYNSSGLFALTNSSGLLSDIYQISVLSKIKGSSGSLACEGVDAFLSDSTTDVVNSYNSLAKITTAERAEYLRNVSQYLLPLNRADTNLFARFVIGKIVRSSTAKVVRDAFKSAVENDLTELNKAGWKSIDQIEANAATLDFAMRVLYSGVKLRLSMPDANESLKTFSSRLTAAAGEQKLSAKISALQGIVKDMQPMLIELMQDPRHGALGEVTQDVAGWVMKN